MYKIIVYPHFNLVYYFVEYSDIIVNIFKIYYFSHIERKANKILAAIPKFWPQIDIDGVFNIWIVKPGNKCRGKGIHLMNNIKDIIALMNIPAAQKTRYVVQKYIGTYTM